jgi:hypothetical protein
MERRARELAVLATKDLNAYTARAQKDKEAYLSTGRNVLLAIARHYNFEQSKVSINRAGIAVSGDITLIGMFNERQGIYIHMSEPRLYGIYGEPYFYYRSISHIKDYTGGINRQMTYERLSRNLEYACEEMKRQVI